MRLTVSPLAAAGASASAVIIARRRGLASRALVGACLWFRLTVETLVIKGEIAPIDLDIITATALLDERGHAPVRPLAPQPGPDLAGHPGQGRHLGRQALDHLEDMEPVIGGKNSAHLPRL